MVKPSTARVTDRYLSAFQSGPESGALFSFGQISSGNLDSRSVWGATGLAPEKQLARPEVITPVAHTLNLTDFWRRAFVRVLPAVPIICKRVRKQATLGILTPSKPIAWPNKHVFWLF